MDEAKKELDNAYKEVELAEHLFATIVLRLSHGQRIAPEIATLQNQCYGALNAAKAHIEQARHRIEQV